MKTEKTEKALEQTSPEQQYLSEIIPIRERIQRAESALESAKQRFLRDRQQELIARFNIDNMDQELDETPIRGSKNGGDHG